MRAVMLDVPPDLLAERSKLGHDRFDEMWEGELHMVPAPNEEHQRIGSFLVALLLPAASDRGLHVRYETNLFDPAAPANSSYRIPDVSIFDEAARSTRGIEGRALAVFEIRSPGDESFEKLPFYDRVGVGEVMIIDRDTKAVRRWHRMDGPLVEVSPGAHGEHRLHALDVTFRTDGDVLVVEVDGAETRI